MENIDFSDLTDKLENAYGLTPNYLCDFKLVLQVYAKLMQGVLSAAGAEQNALLKQLIASVDRANELLSIIARVSGAVIDFEPSPIPFESLSK